MDYLSETFRYLTAIIIGNKNRLKEGAVLKANKSLENYSSDAYMMNVYDVMLQLSLRIYDRADGITYKKIDPEFWLLNAPL